MALSRGNAALLTFAVPGLGHFLLGRPLRGVIAFVVTVGAFAAGYSILHDRLWFVLAVPAQNPVLRAVPVFLLPEFANFGCSVLAAILRDPDSQETARRILLPRDGEALGFLLTGFSGIAAALWASDAFWLASGARRVRVAPAWAAAVTWIVPGAGHVLAGQRSKGLLLGAVVLLVFVSGLALGAGQSVDRATFSLWWAGQAFCGLGTIFAGVVAVPGKMVAYPELLDLGMILCTVAGLMNMMVMTDAYAVAAATATEVEEVTP